MRLERVLTSFCLILSLCLGAQPKLDSLERALEISASDTSRINAMSALATAYFQMSRFDSTVSWAGKILALSRNIHHEKGMARAYELYGMVADYRSEFDEAIRYYSLSLPIYEKAGDTYYTALLNQDLANAYYSKGANDKALRYYMNSLRIREERGDSNAMASSYMGVSNVYSQMHRYDLAIRYAKTALRLKEKYRDKRTASWLLNNLGSYYLEAGDTVSAEPYFIRSIEIKKELNDDYGLATSYKNIGTICLQKKEFDKALEYYRLALRLRYNINPDDIYDIAVSYDDIGSAFMEMAEYDSARFYVGKAIELAGKVGSYELLRLPYYNMAQIMSKKGNYSEAYGYLLKHLAAKDSTLSSETNALMNEMAAKYDNEKKEQQIAMQELEIIDQKKTNIFFIALAALAVILTVVMLRGYLGKKKANRELEGKNALIEHQKALVEEKNKDITDSIRYAQRIQKAILPSADYQKKLLPDSFTLFKPKDIVSGDFYWIEAWKDKIIIAVVDCTGHGVPGAFMTFVAYSLLNEAVLEHGMDDPAAILNEMRRNLNKMLRQKNDSDALKDGMDISVCALNAKSMVLEYAGAYNPLWLARDKAIKEIKADKQPIGVFLDSEPGPFTQHTIKLERGDVIYMFTDGYADQFGGAKGKKFKYKSLQQLLLSVHHKPVDEQRSELDLAFEAWKGNLQQLDDVCILGFRV
ncbi:MAG TPA: tetratricopeptide repeat protein [Bacteroidia bacterium]|jgi:serine phosphatase RsbU (regulator of sigma subunit)